MLIAKNDEVKRSKIWQIVTIVSSVLIIIIAIYLLMKMFTSNPIEGKWISEDGNINLDIRGDETLVVNVSDPDEDMDISVKMHYTMDMDEKVITVKPDVSEYDKIIEESGDRYTREDIEKAVDDIVTSFDYSMEQEQLTLTEREYGEQLTFIRE